MIKYDRLFYIRQVVDEEEELFYYWKPTKSRSNNKDYTYIARLEQKHQQQQPATIRHGWATFNEVCHGQDRRLETERTLIDR